MIGVLVLVAVLLVGGTGGYMIYDKVYKENQKTGTSDKNTDKDKDEDIADKNDKDKVEDKKEEENKGNNDSTAISGSDFEVTFKDETYTLGNVTNKRNLPVIVNKKNQGIADKIVNDLTNKSNVEWESLKASASEHSDIPWPTGVNYMLNTSYKAKNVISFKFERSGAMGGVPWDKSVGYSYDVVTGNMLNFDDILNDGNKEVFYNKVIDLLSKRVSSKESSCFYDRWEDIVKEKMYSEGYWYFTDKGIDFAFDRYELACGGDGTPVVNVSYSEINSYLKSKYRK